MNFYVDDGADIKQIHIMVHPLKIVIHINGKNTLFEHTDCKGALKFLEPYFSEKRMTEIKKYLVDNLKLIGVDVIITPDEPSKEGQQFTLF